MADSTQDNKVLHIPSDLYNDLKAQGGNPGILDLSSKALQDWKKLLSTVKFDEIHLRDKQKNIVGLIQALGAFEFNDEVVAARKAIKWVTITVEAPVQQDGSRAIGFDPPVLRDSICPTLPEHLATALRQLTGLHGLCITLGHFTNQQICDFMDELADEQLLWPELHSLKIEAPPHATIELMRHANPSNIRAFHLCDDVESMPFKKTLGTRGLKSFHLNYDISQLAKKDFWRDIRKVYVGTGRTMNCLVLREKCFDANAKVPLLLGVAMERTRDAVLALGLERFAFSLEYQRLSLQAVRQHLNSLNHESTALQDHEVTAFYTKSIQFLIEAPTLKEVWIFADESLAFKGSVNDDGSVVVERRPLEAGMCQNSFPLGVFN
ncbi:hypothetical protein ACHAQK_003251 [Fusarium lateritium]